MERRLYNYEVYGKLFGEDMDAPGQLIAVSKTLNKAIEAAHSLFVNGLYSANVSIIEYNPLTEYTESLHGEGCLYIIYNSCRLEMFKFQEAWIIKKERPREEVIKEVRYDYEVHVRIMDDNRPVMVFHSYNRAIEELDKEVKRLKSLPDSFVTKCHKRAERLKYDENCMTLFYGGTDSTPSSNWAVWILKKQREVI